MEQDAALLKLPPDELLAVLGKLGPQDLVRCACCCRLLSSLCFSDGLWITLCKPWGHVLNVADWRSSFQSAIALFRILSSLDRLVGFWTAQGDGPRGSLIHVTWGSSCLVACKVLECLTGELKLVKVFEIFGYQDGSFKVELINKDLQNKSHAGVRISGKLILDRKNASEFGVEADEQAFASTVSQDGTIHPDDRSFLMRLLSTYQVERVHDHGQPAGTILLDDQIVQVQDDTSDEATRVRRVNLLRHLLQHRLPNEEDQRGPEEPTGLSFSQRELQYLLSLPATNNSGLEGQSNEERSIERRQVLRYSYSRLNVAEANSETDVVGLWTGLYGLHGTEIIHVTQKDMDIFGTKVLGDPNVPCGEVSFRANLYSESLAVPVELQQMVDLRISSSSQPFHIVKMYKGYGRMAGHNFQDPLWVPGHLLVSSERQIGFIWDDLDFGITFEKLDLDALYKTQNVLGSIL